MSTGDARVDRRGWWGEAWSQVLDASGPSGARRLQRGQALARRGAVTDLTVAPGRLVGTVVEDRNDPRVVHVDWPVPDDEVWEAALGTLRSELRFTATLLDGAIDRELAAALDADGVALVPDLSSLELRCTCPERARLCRHVVALFLVAGTALERDAALLLRFRGREIDDLVHSLRTDADTPVAVAPGLELSSGLDAPRGDLDAVPLHPVPVEDPAGLFRHLGEPPGVEDDRAFVAIIARGAATAWRLAAGDGAEAADEELLLAQLRAHRVATPAALAGALGRDVEAVRADLDRLFEAGAVLRTGSGGGARYRVTAT